MFKMIFTPQDTLFFRDNRPFEVGDATFSVFPKPGTIFGAIRTHYLHANNVNLDAYLSNDPNLQNTYDDIGKAYTMDYRAKLTLKGPFLHYGIDTFFPPPANLIITEDKELIPLKPSNNAEEILWDIEDSPDFRLRPLQIPKDYKLEGVKNPLNLVNLSAYLRDTLSGIDEEEIYTEELRICHRRDYSKKIPLEKHLYSVCHHRFLEKTPHGDYLKGGLCCYIEGVEKGKFSSDSVFLGGERRMVRIEMEEDDVTVELNEIDKEIKDHISRYKKFFIYLATPAIFSAGWYSSKITEITGATLVGVALNKYGWVSGWEYKDNRPKVLRKIVPAGTVYFYEDCPPEKVNDLMQTYQFKSNLSDELSFAGYGVTFIGVW